VFHVNYDQQDNFESNQQLLRSYHSSRSPCPFPEGVITTRGLPPDTVSWTKASTVFSEGLANKRDIICGDMLQKINRKRRKRSVLLYL
jgi:hypothetical protein